MLTTTLLLLALAGTPPTASCTGCSLAGLSDAPFVSTDLPTSDRMAEIDVELGKLPTAWNWKSIAGVTGLSLLGGAASLAFAADIIITIAIVAAVGSGTGVNALIIALLALPIIAGGALIAIPLGIIAGLCWAGVAAVADTANLDLEKAQKRRKELLQERAGLEHPPSAPRAQPPAPPAPSAPPQGVAPLIVVPL